MAILNDLPGLKCEIWVNGAPLTEYDDDDDDGSKPKTATKYVEAVTNATFEVQYQMTNSLPKSLANNSFNIDVHLDGKNMTGTILRSGSTRRLPHYIQGVRYVKGDQAFIEKFCFSHLAIDDGDPRAMTQSVKKALGGLGEISVRFHRVNILGDVHPREDAKSATMDELGVIPEKALKGRAISHQAKLQNAVTTAKYNVLDVDWIDPQSSPYATFNFRYRSRDALKALCVIPRSPSPVPLEDRPVEELTPEEMRELLKRQRERGAAAPRVKQEVKRERTTRGYSAFENSDELSLVEERPRKRYRTTIDEDNVETVDLT